MFRSKYNNVEMAHNHSQLTDAKDTILQRKYVAGLIYDVLVSKITVLEAVSSFPKEIEDDSVKTCFHILMHLEADEDIRNRDIYYKEEQDEFLETVSAILKDGEPLPVNIINEYKNFYTEPPIYPIINKENIIKRLKKFINLT